MPGLRRICWLSCAATRARSARLATSAMSAARAEVSRVKVSMAITSVFIKSGFQENCGMSRKPPGSSWNLRNAALDGDHADVQRAGAVIDHDKARTEAGDLDAFHR